MFFRFLPFQIFQIAENLLRTASQQSRVAEAKIHAAWLLLDALISLGNSVISEHMPRIVKLWHSAFPRSAKEAGEEIGRGDEFSWRCCLESRSGALATMAAVARQKDLVDQLMIEKEMLPKISIMLTTMNKLVFHIFFLLRTVACPILANLILCHPHNLLLSYSVKLQTADLSMSVTYAS